MPPNGTNVNAATYSAPLLELRKNVKNRWRGMLSDEIIILHDNSCPRTTAVSSTFLMQFCWKILEHPSYKLGLLLLVNTPSSVHCKKALKGQRFHDDNEVQVPVENLFHNLHRSFFTHGVPHVVDP
ncbi:hypothetical protein TNCV_475701 [Trichonephila clavipes]|nr:hypothetical protein TNCV_475701 [Trichonephila clavipes]